MKYEGFGGGPLLVGGLGPGPPAPPLKSGPDYFHQHFQSDRHNKNGCIGVSHHATTPESARLGDQMLSSLVYLQCNEHVEVYQMKLKSKCETEISLRFELLLP